MKIVSESCHLSCLFGQLLSVHPLITLLSMKKHIPCTLLLLLLSGTSFGQQFNQLTRPVATLVRPSLIDSFLVEMLIPPPDTVSAIEVIDLTGNGYGPDDILVLYPSQEAYPISAYVPRVLQDVMKGWELEADYRLDATLDESKTLEPDAHRRKDPKDAISGAIISAVDHYYVGTDMEMRLTRGADGLRLEMWNYDPNAMQYRPWPQGHRRTQQFQFAAPRFVTTFREAGTCIDAFREGEQVFSRPCQTQ